LARRSSTCSSAARSASIVSSACSTDDEVADDAACFIVAVVATVSSHNATPHTWQHGACASFTASQQRQGLSPSVPPHSLQYFESNGFPWWQNEQTFDMTTSRVRGMMRLFRERV
jgi:hypothetical protein